MKPIALLRIEPLLCPPGRRAMAQPGERIAGATVRRRLWSTSSGVDGVGVLARHHRADAQRRQRHRIARRIFFDALHGVVAVAQGISRWPSGTRSRLWQPG